MTTAFIFILSNSWLLQEFLLISSSYFLLFFIYSSLFFIFIFMILYLPLIFSFHDSNFPCHTCDSTILNLLSANPTKWSNTLKQFVGSNWVLIYELKQLTRRLVSDLLVNLSRSPLISMLVNIPWQSSLKKQYLATKTV